MTKTVDDFIEFASLYVHIPSVDTECEFGEHWWCDCENWRGYSFGEYLYHLKMEFDKLP